MIQDRAKFPVSLLLKFSDDGSVLLRPKSWTLTKAQYSTLKT